MENRRDRFIRHNQQASCDVLGGAHGDGIRFAVVRSFAPRGFPLPLEMRPDVDRMR